MQLVINVAECPDYISIWLHSHENILKKIISESVKDHFNLFKTQMEFEHNSLALTNMLECLINQQWNFFIDTNFAIEYQTNCLNFAEFIINSAINIKTIHRTYSAITKTLSKYVLEQETKKDTEIVFYLNEFATTDLINLISIRQEVEYLQLSKQKKLIKHTIENSIINNLQEVLQHIAKVSTINNEILKNSQTFLLESGYLENNSKKLNTYTTELANAIKHLKNNISNTKYTLTDYCNIPKKNIQKLAITIEKTTETMKNIEIIAKQANLLSLNATIEAARSGNYNKSFKVVAEEIKNLATRITTAIETVFKQTAEMQKTTDEFIIEATEVNSSIINNTDTTSSNQMGNSIDVIHNLLLKIQNINDNFSEPLKAVASSANKIDSSSKRLQNQTNIVSSSTKNFVNLSENLKY